MIGKMEKVALREVWKGEAKDFNSWLFKNIEVLGEELNLNMTAIEKEKGIGSFSADIVAETETGQKVIIENQLEKTNHDHLGKILTYVSNLEAKIAIWISSNPRPEHEKAIDWLNESTAGVSFYLIKVEAYKIGISEPAPLFTVIAGPTEESKVVGEEKKEFAERHKKRLMFWRNLLEKAKLKTNLHSGVSPSIYSYISTGAGKRGLGYNYAITYKYASVELYIDRGPESKKENKKIFDELFSHKKSIEKIFSKKLDWERLDKRRASRIAKRYKNFGLNEPDKWDLLQNDMIDDMIRLEKALNKHIKELKI